MECNRTYLGALYESIAYSGVNGVKENCEEQLIRVVPPIISVPLLRDFFLCNTGNSVSGILHVNKKSIRYVFIMAL